MARPPISIVIVDDQERQRSGYRMVLESQKDFTIVGEAADGAVALAITRRTKTDVVLMDIRMPRVNGFVATERIRNDAQVLTQGPPPSVVLVTALDLDDYIGAAAQAGAYAILYKDVPPEALFEAIRTAAKHHAAE
jgi:DNA-binding NarL/FixJ family response regulator